MTRQPVFEAWPGVWEKWSRRYTYENFWRVQRTLGSIEDALAECALIYVDCQRRYGRTCKTPQQFMHLYQLMIKCRFTDYSKKESKARQLEENFQPQESSPCDTLAIGIKLGEASSELRDVLNVLFNAPAEVLETIIGDAAVPAKTIFKRVCKFLRIERSTGLVEELQTLLK